MKSKIISVLTNCILSAVVLVSAFVGFYGKDTVDVVGEGAEVYRSGQGRDNGVSLMFNVYEHTENVLKIADILEENGATATFFIGGSWADDNVECVRDLYGRGFELASHGYFHKDHSKMTYAENLEEIAPSVKLVNMICLTEISLFAPPSGAYNDETLKACTALGLKVILWSRDTIDWRDQNVGLIYSRATKNLKSGEFILMHPTDCTVKALPEILSYIRDCGMQTATVSYNLGE